MNDLGSGRLVEYVSGPYCGYFFAGYALARSDGFDAYVKICGHRPQTPWDTCGQIKVFSYSKESARAALRLAVIRALCVVNRWAESVGAEAGVLDAI